MSLNSYIIAYRLEDMQGQSKDYIDGRPVILPDGYFLANTDPCVYKDSVYKILWPEYHLYEYLLYSRALSYPHGEVLFRESDILSKTKLGV